MHKEIDQLGLDQKIINDKYMNFQKEKSIFQTERDNMMNELKNVESMMTHNQFKVMDEIAAYKNHFNI